MIWNFAKTSIDRSKVVHPLLALAVVICDKGRFSRAAAGRWSQRDTVADLKSLAVQMDIVVDERRLCVNGHKSLLEGKSVTESIPRVHIRRCDAKMYFPLTDFGCL